MQINVADFSLLISSKHLFVQQNSGLIHTDIQSEIKKVWWIIEKVVFLHPN